MSLDKIDYCEGGASTEDCGKDWDPVNEQYIDHVETEEEKEFARQMTESFIDWKIGEEALQAEREAEVVGDQLRRQVFNERD